MLDGSPALTVVDTGIGIPQERLEQIFEPFQLAKAEVARQHGGTGLGLSISKRLMELHGGTLTLSSTVGTGTQAQITFPNWRLLSDAEDWTQPPPRSEEHTSELQSLMRISDAGFCLKK